MGREDPVGQPVVAHELPDIFDRVEFGAFGRQRNEADILWHFELSGHVPPGLIHQQNAVGTGFDSERYLRQVQRHGVGVAEREDQTCPLAKLWADGAEDVGRFRPLVLGRRRPGAPSGPAASDLVFLADPRFVLEPDF